MQIAIQLRTFMVNRTGQIFGSLLVINDNGTSQLLCRCKCGTEGNYPRTITKPDPAQ